MGNEKYHSTVLLLISGREEIMIHELLVKPTISAYRTARRGGEGKENFSCKFRKTVATKQKLRNPDSRPLQGRNEYSSAPLSRTSATEKQGRMSRFSKLQSFDLAWRAPKTTRHPHARRHATAQRAVTAKSA